MHVLFEHFCIDQVFTAQLVNLLLADKLILVINDFFLLLFELFCDILDVRNPFRGGSELGNEETANFGVLQCGQDHTAVWHNCAHIDSVLGLNTCNEVAIAVCDFDLLLVAENYVFFVIVQEVNRIDRLVVRRFQTEQLSVKSDIENWQSAALTHTHQQTCVITLDLAHCRCWFHFADSFLLPEIPHFELIPTTKHNVQPFIKAHWVDKTVSMQRSHELSLFQWNSVNLICRSRYAKIWVHRVEDEVARVVRDTGLVMSAVLCVEFDCTVGLGHGDLTVVVGEDSELYNFAVKAS